ncbi:type I-E CRISPR-associated protein Cas5/CasD [Actinokineospora diospyrosa]
MQSWGTRSHGVDRDTALEPSKSGVVGLLAAALGIEREDDNAIAELAALRLGVRVDREGVVERDYHVTQNVPTTDGTGHRTVVSERFYLANALFLVALEGPREQLTRVAAAVRDPRYPVYFGRKAFVPARPLLHKDATSLPGTVEQVLAEHAQLVATRANEPTRVRIVVDCSPSDPRAELRHDHPVSFTQGHRRHRTRTVLVDHITLPGATPCT